LRIKLGALVGVLAVATLLPIASAGAAPADEHCAARVMDKKSTGELVLGPTVCRSTRSAALVAVGARSETGITTQQTWIIGTHYDGVFSGSSFTVVGTSCSGGWLNVDSSWKNRISSTINGCNRIIHYDGDNLTGLAESTYGSSALGALNNKTNSIQYTT
jgi:hypothetical protein